MKIFKGSNAFVSKKPVALTIGNFDGVHAGHAELIAKLLENAKKIKGAAVIYTFSPHPAKLIAPTADLKLLQTEAQKMKELAALGVDICIVETFTGRFAKITSEKFLHELILKKIRPQSIIVGHDLTFGWHRKGTVEHMKKFCRERGIGFKAVNAFFKDDILISSSQVRRFVASGELELAKKILGRPYSLKGRVIKGRGIGRTIGVHTANLKVENELIPPSGVYITRTLGKLSLTNIGYNPTVGGSRLSVETHILGHTGELYGKELEVFFYKRIRRELIFKDVVSLKEQIMKDIKEAKKYEKF